MPKAEDNQANSTSLIAAPTQAEVGGSAGGDAFRVGDTLGLVFYENIATDEDKWGGPAGRQSVAPKSFYQRPELTGKYGVGNDGTISVPLLGRFKVEGMAPRDVETTIAASYAKLVERKGFVNILSVEHRPIYVAGPVKTPGRYEYSPGMTVLHAISLAGGMQTSDIQPWQKVEIERQVERLKNGLNEVKRLVARTSVLDAEREGKEPTDIRIAGLISNEEAGRLIHDEQSQRNLLRLGQSASEEVLAKAVESAKADLDLRMERVGTYDENIRRRQSRVDGMNELARNKLIGSAELTRVQAELADAEDRKQQAVIDVEDAKQRLANATRELDKQRVEKRIEIAKASAEAERGSSDAIQTAEGDLSVFESLMPSFGLATAIAEPSYEIVRRGKAGVVVEKASEDTTLEPGDLVRVR